MKLNNKSTHSIDKSQNKEHHAAKSREKSRDNAQAVAPGQIIHPRTRHP